MSLEKEIYSLEESAFKTINALEKEQDILMSKAAFLGRKGKLTSILKSIKDLSPDEKVKIGQIANSIKNKLEDLFEKRLSEIKEAEIFERLKSEKIDITVPGRRMPVGNKHPLSIVLDEIVEIFEFFGFETAEGPEVELDYYNFEALNMPKNHPARDMQDTFYFSDEILLRTHTSPVQIRTMEKRKPPLRIIAPGKVYRCDADITHSPMFHQIEGLVVDKDISFADLKAILTHFVHRFFGRDISLRFRPSFFPFTEPSAEVDIKCVLCMGDGCRVCKNSGWLEILGSGMVDPEVFKHVGYDPELYSGYAFGMGIERIAMLKYRINDIRLFFENDIRFLKEF